MLSPSMRLSLVPLIAACLSLPLAAQDALPGFGAADPVALPAPSTAGTPSPVPRPGADATAPATVRLLPGMSAATSGEDYTAVLEIAHQPGYHSYWRNWGSAGSAPKVDWTLPAGVAASEIDFATPHAITTSGLPGFGYEGVVRHLVHFSLPADAAGSLEIRGKVDLLVCNNDGCFPLIPAPELNLSVPIRAGSGAVASAELTEALAHQPEAVDWPATWKIEGENVVLAIQAPDAATAAELAGGAYFSGETSATASRTDLAKPVVLAADGATLTITAPLSRGTITRGVGDQRTWTGLLVGNADGSGPARELSATREGAPTPGGTGSATSADAFPGSAADPFADPAVVPDAAAPALPLPTILGFALLGGLILNVMPCVFPVLGLKVMGVVSQAGGQRREIVLHGLAYTAGVLVFFWVLAGLLIWLKQGFGLQLGNGFQLQNRYVVYVLAFLLLLVALNLAGLFEVGTSLTATGQGLQHRSGFAGSFFTGALATIVATPCTAPFLGPALGAAFQLPPVGIVVTFTAMGLGLALPFLLLSAFPALVEKLPRPGAWMESMKVFFAFLMFGATGFMLSIYAGLVKAGSTEYLGKLLPVDAFLAILLALTLLAMAAWIYGRWGQRRHGRARIWGNVAAGAIALFSVACAVPKKAAFEWEHWTPEREAGLRADGTPYFIDFTATWCATCQTNKATYVDNREVARLVVDRGIVMLKADWTDRNDAITRRLQELNRASVPTNILWHPGLDQPEILPDTWTSARTVIERFEKVE